MADKGLHVPSATVGPFGDAVGTRPGLAAAGHLGWEIAFPFFGKSGPTSFIPKEPGRCAQLKGCVGVTPACKALTTGPSTCPHHPGERSLSAQRAPHEGLGSGRVWNLRTPASPGAPCPLPGIACLHSVLCLEPSGLGLARAGVGLCWVHKHQPAIQWPCEQGEPSAGLDKVSKNKSGPLARCIPPSCWQLLIYANQMRENPKSPVGPRGQGGSSRLSSG